MPVAPPSLQKCSVCETTLDPNGTCPRCRAPEDWNDQAEALDFVVRRLKEWHQAGQLTDRQMQSLAEHYQQRRDQMMAASNARSVFQADATYSRRDECWSCKEYLYKSSSHCHSCGAPVTDPGVRSLRYLDYLYRELMQHEDSGAFTLRQSHEFLADVNERINALKRKLERERAPFVLPVAEEPAPRPRRRPRREVEEEQPAEDEGPRRSFLEVLVDPHSIQWLLAAGGALIVLGLVIWLMSLGLFQNALAVAVILGIGNALLLAGGWALMLRTRFDNAGRALTLLACMVMPLNLWFYHSNGLIILSGNLWVPALFCCIVYTASALVLRDTLFVYVLVGGVTLTGLLILGRFDILAESFAPTAMLVILALICLHAERAFPSDVAPAAAPLPEAMGESAQTVVPAPENPFSRERFGMAFYWCSLVLMCSGLLLLLGAQFIGWLHDPILRHVGMRNPPDVATMAYLPYTLMLVLAGTYYYIYADLVVRKLGVYIYLAAITLLWAEIHILALSELARQEGIIILTLSLTALAVNAFQVSFRSTHQFLRTVPPLGMLLSLLPVFFGVLLHFRATNSVLNDLWRAEAGARHEISWSLALAMAVTALCCRAGAYFYRHTFREVSLVYWFATAVATLVFAAELTWLIGLKPWEQEAPLVMIVPILYLIASYLYRGHSPEQPLIWAAHGAVGLMIFFSAWVVMNVTPQVVQPVQGEARNLLLALFCLEAAVFYGVAAFLRRTNWTIYVATVMLCGAIWQFLLFFHTRAEFYTIAFALPGFVLLVVHRFGLFDKLEVAGLDRATFQSANALTTLGFVSGALLSLTRVLSRDVDLARLDDAGEWRGPIRIVMILLIALTVISLLSAWFVQHQVWRRVYLVLSIVNGLLLVLVIHRLSNLNIWQNLEIFTIILGVLMLIGAFIGWYYETERSSDLVSFAFLFGSIGVTLPLLIAIIAWRMQGEYQPGLDDLGLVIACVVLFGTGIVCRIKASTLVGASAMGIYLLIIIIGLHRHLADAWIIGIYLALGGVVLFGTGLFLSLYRDWLLSLPDKIRRREGVFRIFDWR